MQSRIISFLGDFPKYAMETLFVLGIGVMTAVVFAQESSADALGILALFALPGSGSCPAWSAWSRRWTRSSPGMPSLELIEGDIEAMKTSSLAEAERGVPLPLDRALTVDSVSFRYDDADVDVAVRL